MRLSRPIARFVCVFLLLYVALTVPWPGWKAAYGTWFRAFGEGVAAVLPSSRTVRMRDAGPSAPLDTQILLIDPKSPVANGHQKALVLNLDSRSVGWIPTAFLCALVISTPIPWRRRLRALGLGLLAIHIYLSLVLASFIWNQSVIADGGAGSQVSPFSRWLLGALEETLVTQLGPSFVIPALIWILLAFSLADLERFYDAARIRRAPS
jgi:hypothetical protein